MRTIVFVAIGFTLTACGGDSNNSSANPGPTSEPTPGPYTSLQAPEPSGEVLQFASSEELTRLLKNGVRRDTALYTGSQPQPTPEAGDANFALDDVTAYRAVDADYSQTNVQVAGVDEADFVKYDGSYLFMHTWPDWTQPSPAHEVRVLSTDPETASAESVSTIELGNENFPGFVELYLLDGETRADALVTLASEGYFGWCGVGGPEPFIDYYYSAPQINVQLHDMENPESPQTTWQLELDGQLHHSRKIGDMLYLVTSHMPQLPIRFDQLMIQLTEDGDIEQVLNEVNVEDMLPGYRINGGERQLLHSTEDCLMGETDEFSSYRSLHQLVAIDLRNQQVADSLCLGTPVEGLYSSQNSLYLGASRWAENWQDSYTVLHKFSLADNRLEYVATGSVPGRLGWNNPSFRMDEYQGAMRVLTSSWEEQGMLDHRLWILQENSEAQTLELIAQLPNENETSPIGKPGEDVYAVRFFGDRGYIVTFERMDPLYVLDLSEASSPSIAGELELPGFSTYLHPLDEGYLFGFGQDADNEGRVTSLKAALFDVREPANPSVVSEITMGGSWSWSDALYDHKAFNFLRRGEGELRITFPATLYPQNQSNGINTLWVQEEVSRVMVLLEASGLQGDEADMQLHGAIKTPNYQEREWWDYSAFGRGILHGEALYYIDEPRVWSAFWSEPETVFGPF